MRKLILAVPLVAALAALAVPSLASAATGNITCTDNSLAGKTITSNVTVPAGATCDLSGPRRKSRPV